jgi:hypothetical protein
MRGKCGGAWGLKQHRALDTQAGQRRAGLYHSRCHAESCAVRQGVPLAADGLAKANISGGIRAGGSRDPRVAQEAA